MSLACVPSPRNVSIWFARIKARTAASTATASRGANSSSRCSVREIVRAFEAVKDAFDPKGLLNPEPYRPRAALRRPVAVPLCAGLRSDRGLQAATRLVGFSRAVGRPARRRRDVQQQRPLPQVRCRRDVPELSRHARRAASRARPRQYASARPQRPAGNGGVGLERRGGGAEALRLLQGLPARMSDRRRHGQDEDRGEAARAARHGIGLRERLVADLPRYAPLAASFPAAANLRNNVPLLRRFLDRTSRPCRAARSADLAVRSLSATERPSATPAPRRWAT